MNADEVRRKLQTACELTGSVAAWCAAHDMSSTYVGRVLSGRDAPGPKLLTAMGLMKIVTYEAIA